jgi:hypothetical protein
MPVSAREFTRYLMWALRPESSPPSEPISFEFECMTCGAMGPPSEDFSVAQGWTLEHLATQPSHTGFHEHVHRYWRAELVDVDVTPVRELTAVVDRAGRIG